MGFRLIQLIDSALACGIFVFGIHKGFAGSEDRLACRLVLLLCSRGIVISLLDFLIECLLRIIHLQLLVKDSNPGRADSVACLEAVEERDCQSEAQGLAPILVQLVAKG